MKNQSKSKNEATSSIENSADTEGRFQEASQSFFGIFMKLSKERQYFRKDLISDYTINIGVVCDPNTRTTTFIKYFDTIFSLSGTYFIDTGGQVGVFTSSVPEFENIKFYDFYYFDVKKFLSSDLLGCLHKFDCLIIRTDRVRNDISYITELFQHIKCIAFVISEENDSESSFEKARLDSSKIKKISYFYINPWHLMNLITDKNSALAKYDEKSFLNFIKTLKKSAVDAATNKFLNLDRNCPTVTDFENAVQTQLKNDQEQVTDLHTVNNESAEAVKKDSNWENLLYLATKFNNVSHLESIISQCSNKNIIHARIFDNQTALMIAVKHESIIMVEKLLDFYAKFNIRLNSDEKDMVFDMAVKTNKAYLIKFLFIGAENDIEAQHDILKKSIQRKFSRGVEYFLACKQWQDIFRRHPSDVNSPIQLLLFHLPETAILLFDKCVKEGQQEYLNALLDDYPTNSKSLESLQQSFHSLATTVRRKYEQWFGRGQAVTESHSKED